MLTGISLVGNVTSIDLRALALTYYYFISRYNPVEVLLKTVKYDAVTGALTYVLEYQNTSEVTGVVEVTDEALLFADKATAITEATTRLSADLNSVSYVHDDVIQSAAASLV